MTRLPGGPSGRLLTTYRALSNCFRYFPLWRDRYGDPFTLKVVNGTVVLTAEPALIQEIFAADPDLFDPFGSKAIAPLVGSGSLLVLSGETHRRERKLLMPPFHGSRMRAYGDEMRAATLRWLEGAAEVASLQAIFQRISLDVIARTVFGVREASRIDRFGDAVIALIDGVPPSIIFMPFLQVELGGLSPFARFLRRSAAFDALLKEEIRRVRETAGGEDILSLLVTARYDDGAGMDDDSICSELRTVLVAGHETTALGLSWAIDHLHRDPVVKARVMAELDALGPDPGPSELAAAPYLDAVCKETLRLYPLVTEVLRTLKRPFRLGSYSLEAGEIVGANIVLSHRSPERFPDPERFRPERFLERDFTPFEYLPFGGGHRRCIGSAFASFEMKVVLGTLLSRYRVELVNEDPPRPVRRNVTIAPHDGVPVRLRPREAGARPRAA